MKKLLSLILIISSSITFINGYAQTNEYPVKWKTSVKKVAENEYELTATADINDNWHLYANELPSDGPVPTTFYFDKNEEYKKEGKIVEGEGAYEADDATFKKKVKFFDNKASFTQKIKVKSGKRNIKITGVVEYMVCSKTTCLPPTESTLAFNVTESK